MLERLIDILYYIVDELKFWVVIPYYDRGIRLRFGKPRGEELVPGIHWKLPFADSILTCMVKTKTIELAEQSVTTKDYQAIVVKGVIKYEISDVRTLLLEVNDAVDAVADMSKGIIRSIFINNNWKECNDPEIQKQIGSKIKNEAKKWGIRISEVTLTDLSLMRSIRILNSKPDGKEIF